MCKQTALKHYIGFQANYINSVNCITEGIERELKINISFFSSPSWLLSNQQIHEFLKSFAFTAKVQPALNFLLILVSFQPIPWRFINEKLIQEIVAFQKFYAYTQK